MISAYYAGAKYVMIPLTLKLTYGILSQEHLAAMEQFWIHVKTNPRSTDTKVIGEAALVLPQDYGWGMRHTVYITQDRLWGIFPEDEKSPLILNSTAKLLDKYGSKLDIIYEDQRFDYKDKYGKIYFWNSTIP
jgi:hypothetical protein